MASTNRAPFDLPEAESELVAGFLTEYSGFRWVVFFMAEYAAIFAVCGLGAILFLGGWNGPVPIGTWIAAGIDHLLSGVTTHHADIAAWIGNLFGMCNFIAKGIIGGTVVIWARWSLPRLRIDQVMTTCLKYCVPLASAMLAGVMLWCYFLPGGVMAQVRHRMARGTEEVVGKTSSTADDSLRQPPPSPSVASVEQHSRLSLRESIATFAERKATIPAYERYIAAPGEREMTDAVNWNSFLLPAAGRDRLCVRRGGRRQRQHRPHGVLPDRVAGGGGGLVLHGRRRLSRRRPDHGLRRRHDGPFGVRRDADRPWAVRFDENRRRTVDHWPIIIGGALLAVLLQAAFSIPGWAKPSKDLAEAKARASHDAESATERLGLGLMGVRTDRLELEPKDIRRGGMSGYLLPFEIISIHLVVVLVGAAYLARRGDARSRDL